MDLVGAWRLVEWRIGAPGSGVSYPFGRDAVGLLCYTPDGYMSMTVSRAGHAPSPAGSPRDVSPEEASGPLTEPLPKPLAGSPAEPSAVPPARSPARSPVEASASFLCCAGRYEVRKGQIAHDVELSLDRSVAGAVQVRELNVNGDHLVLAASERGCWHTMIWRRS